MFNQLTSNTKDEWTTIIGMCGRLLIPEQIYPDEGHFLHSDGTQQHLSQSLVNFFEMCFRVPETLTGDQQDEDEDNS